MVDLPWEGAIEVASSSGQVVLLADASGSYYAAMAPDGTPLGGTGVTQLTSAMESSAKKAEIKLPKAKDLEAFAGQGTLIVDPKTGEVRVGSKSEADAILGDKARDWPMITTQVDNTLRN